MLGWCSINLDDEGSCSLFLCDVELPLSLQISLFFFLEHIFDSNMKSFVYVVVQG